MLCYNQILYKSLYNFTIKMLHFFLKKPILFYIWCSLVGNIFTLLRFEYHNYGNTVFNIKSNTCNTSILLTKYIQNYFWSFVNLVIPSSAQT